MTTKFAQFTAFDAARKQVEQDMTGFLQRMRNGSRLRQEVASNQQATQNKGSQQNKKTKTGR
ncbi:hypothetical protein [Burkholderia pseudomallei]|uniref:hypothetical protein n=1 Tax=Burkholderia pseudomallei TaxID=28450 RepID=UPI000A5C8480|nr:hypothetical protein [Burkholderia pseudomallei]MBF3519326.1 hypothetical protein [Burkholderia pseudomallei]MVZ82729.1 hypothetical protein [Burkholderia pseudomallei]MWA22836.1 hypothetical protein [Burkholderia pseudomallei]MWA23337.1 hypothetical protein [Burkholderia pseudomallei]